MYKSFFGLRASPFNVNPDPRFLYNTRNTREALACLTYGIQSRKGFVLLTGEVGTGKTTLLNRFLEWLRMQHIATAFIFNPKLTTSEFFNFMMADFGIPCDTKDKSQVLLKLNHWLLGRYRAGDTAVLIIDEAQNLSSEVLEEIRLLTNLETSTEKLLQIVLSGQPELDAKLKDPSLRQLKQRITLRCKTHPLNKDEAAQYVVQRLKTAGSSGVPIFTDEALEAIFRFSRGIPRVINLLSEHALISGFVDQIRPIPAETIENVAREFELVEGSNTVEAQEAATGENVSLIEALKVLSNVGDKLRQLEVGAPGSKKA